MAGSRSTRFRRGRRVRAGDAAALRGGTVKLRGHTFAAQQLGSFDGYSWLWSWANTHLDIPDGLVVHDTVLGTFYPR